jgi:predicted PurR-regulated permease PerM
VKLERQEAGHEPSPVARKLEANLGWIALVLLLAGCLLVLRPFISAVLWAIVLCFSTWPVYRRLLKVMGNRRTLAALVMSVAMILIVLVPFLIIGATLAGNVKALAAAIQHWVGQGPPAPPAWLERVPGIGQPVSEYWRSLEADTAKLWAEVQPFIEKVTGWLLVFGVALGRGVLELALSILVAFFLFRDGLAAAERLTTGVERIAGERGKHLLEVAGNTVRGVVYGILGTALAQGILAGLGYVIAGVPAAGLLALITFFVSVVPIVGTALVWVPVAIWLFHVGATGWGVFMLIWGLAVANIDNVLKPWLISQGSNMPFILIFFGVLGGAAAFGFIGVFLGPTLLAVGFRVIEEWVATRPAVTEDETTGAAP